MRLLGKSGTAYVVGTASETGGHGRICRVTADGARTLLAKAHPFMSILSRRRRHPGHHRERGDRHEHITVYDVATGAQFTQRALPRLRRRTRRRDRRVAIGTTKKTSSGHDRRFGHRGSSQRLPRRRLRRRPGRGRGRHLHQGPLRRRLHGRPQDHHRRAAVAVVHRAGARHSTPTPAGSPPSGSCPTAPAPAGSTPAPSTASTSAATRCAPAGSARSSSRPDRTAAGGQRRPQGVHRPLHRHRRASAPATCGRRRRCGPPEATRLRSVQYRLTQGLLNRVKNGW